MVEALLTIVAVASSAASIFLFYKIKKLAADARQSRDAAELAIQDTLTHSTVALNHSKAAMAHANLAENHAKVGLEFSMAMASRFASSLFETPRPVTVPPLPLELSKELGKDASTKEIAKMVLNTPNVNW
jgi:hypothetical protein